MVQLIAGLVIAGITVTGVAYKEGGALIPTSDAKPVEYSEPGTWFVWSPAEHLSPRYSVEDGSLVLESNGSKNNIGKWAFELEGMTGGEWYTIGASYRTERVDYPWESVIGVLSWFGKEHRLLQCDYLVEAGEKDGWRRIERLIQMPSDAERLDISLYFRWAAQGRVLYRDVSVQPAKAPKPRKVKLAVVSHYPQGGKTPEDNFAQFENYLEEAGKQGADIVCLGEAISSVGTGISSMEVASPLDGRNTRMLRDYAKKFGIYIVSSLDIKEEDRLYNMAVLIDRQGEIAGTYRKVHLPFTETLAGVIPGDDFPVFETDFGKVGMQICYDNFFPETARSLKLNGAEIILLPIWGDGRWNNAAWDVISRARAIDNSVFLMASNYSQKRSLIIDPTGKILQDSDGAEGLFVQEIDLNATTREMWLSVGALGEWKNLFGKERRPSAYRTIKASPLQLRKERR